MTETPKDLTNRPAASGPTTDLLSLVLGQIRLTGDRVHSRTLAPRSRLDLPAEAAHLFVVTDGELRIEGGDKGTVVVASGDLVMLPRGAGELRGGCLSSFTRQVAERRRTFRISPAPSTRARHARAAARAAGGNAGGCASDGCCAHGNFVSRHDRA